ncbi:hypothetical protein IE53DRAFT_387461 [Violaceomyces palustris]|uniref:Uncharacterized protein n=1 Tax=Violaceomyces palustris TaxID=1673888 RepID=A0ACD0NWT7_9BASI|nr:hypothetical protein IE53DRAFT_387461 [Violaceomyces palustris]
MSLKRQRRPSHSTQHELHHTTEHRRSTPPIDSVLSDEHILRILHFLGPRELTRLHSVSSNFNRLAGDPQLWKRLFYQDYIHLPSVSPDCKASPLPTLAGLKSLLIRQQRPSRRSSPPRDGRRIARLPRRYRQDPIPTKPIHSNDPSDRPQGTEKQIDDERHVSFIQTSADEIRNDGLDWKALYQVSHNWQKGNFAVSELLREEAALNPFAEEASWIGQAQDRRAIEAQPTSQRQGTRSAPHDPGSGPQRPKTLVQASSSLVFTASRETSLIPAHGPLGKEMLPAVRVYSVEDSRSGNRTSGGGEEPRPHDPTRNRSVVVLHSDKLLSLLLREPAASLIRKNGLSITEIRLDKGETPLQCSTASTRPQHQLKGKSKATDGNEDDAIWTEADVSRLLVCYSSGHLVIFQISSIHGPNSSGTLPESRLRYFEEVVHQPLALASSGKSSGGRRRNIVDSAIHASLVVTCTEDFTISIYRKEEGNGKEGGPSRTSGLELIQEFSSFGCWWPACIRLRRLPVAWWPSSSSSSSARRPRSASDYGKRSSRKGEESAAAAKAYRLTIAYSTPAYPTSWTVGIQEMIISFPGGDNKRPIISSRHATATPLSARTPLDTKGRSIFKGGGGERCMGRKRFLTWGDGRMKHQGDRAREPSRNVEERGRNRVTSVTYDEPFVILGAEDNLIEVYEVLGASTFVRSQRSYHKSDPCRPSAEMEEVEEEAVATETPRRTNLTRGTGGPLRIVHRRALYGHTGGVQSVALEDGRCVSGGSDGSVMVWSLGGNDRLEEEDDDRRSSFSSNHSSGPRFVQGGRRRRRLRRGSRSSLFKSPKVGGLRDLQEEGDDVDEAGWEEDEEDEEDEMEEEDDISNKIRHVVTLRTPHPSSVGRTRGRSKDGEEGDGDGKGNVARRPAQHHDLDLDPRSHSPSSDPSTPPTLRQLLRIAKREDEKRSDQGRDPQRPAVIKWVSTAFDKIFSVISVEEQVPSPSSSETDAGAATRKEARLEAESLQEREQVQVWSFGR